jgi:hypothetical protein
MSRDDSRLQYGGVVDGGVNIEEISSQGRCAGRKGDDNAVA